tara:strand:- start:27319 stop:28962 length:1644 start_codon:yes stop_codon:yes gene_type:complete
MNFKPQILDKIKKLKANTGNNFLKNNLYGIEKEALRITQKGNLSVNSHPEALGSKLTSEFITTDYSESQLELITPPKNTIEESVSYLEHLSYYVANNINKQMLWPCSMPCILPNEKEIPIAHYGKSNQGKLKELYRTGLKYRYGKTMQMISGVHFNFSFSQDFLSNYTKTINNQTINQENINDIYINVSRNYLRYSWLITYVFGASPIVTDKFLQNNSPSAFYLKPDPENFKQSNEYFAPYGTSLRMSELGYQNSLQSSNNVSFNSLDEYIKDFTNALSTENLDFKKIGVKTKNNKYLQINSNNLQIENELYNPIRLKSQKNKNLSNLKNLYNHGIEYIELRNIDVNPFSKQGFDVEQGYFLEIFLFFCTLIESPKFSSNKLELLEIKNNLSKITTFGLHEGLTIKYNNQTIFLQDFIKDIFESLEIIADFLDFISESETKNYSKIFNKYKKIIDNNETCSAKIIKQVYNKDSKTYNSFQEFGLNLAQKYSYYFAHDCTKNLNSELLDIIKQDTKNSLLKFQDINNQNQISFDDFLIDFNKNQTNFN